MDTRKNIKYIHDLIKESRGKIVDILTDIEPYSISEFEVDSACATLYGLLDSVDQSQIDVKSIAVYLPVNLPLYSLILYGFVPSLQAENVYIRPPVEIGHIMKKIYDLLFKTVKNVHIIDLPRRAFGDGFTACADVVIFTGRHDTALGIIEKYNPKLFIYNGSGVNPIIIAKGANLSLAVEKVIQARIFNSGQDCCAPDAIFIEESIKREFMYLLRDQVEKISVGSYKDPDVTVGKILDRKYIALAKAFLEKKAGMVILGGKIDEEGGIIYPTIIDEVDHQRYDDFQELYAPIFNILTFKASSEVENVLNSKEYQDFAMCYSVFGDIEINVANTIFLKNKILLDIEGGNIPFGGYGRKSSFIRKNGKIFPRPILISKEIKLTVEPNSAEGLL